DRLGLVIQHGKNPINQRKVLKSLLGRPRNLPSRSVDCSMSVRGASLSVPGVASFQEQSNRKKAALAAKRSSLDVDGAVPHLCIAL
ncbi:phosphoribosylaminoimidazole carboxylase, partial [Corchorus capsularis]